MMPDTYILILKIGFKLKTNIKTYITYPLYLARTKSKTIGLKNVVCQESTFLIPKKQKLLSSFAAKKCLIYTFIQYMFML